MVIGFFCILISIQLLQRVCAEWLLISIAADCFEKKVKKVWKFEQIFAYFRKKMAKKFSVEWDKFLDLFV